MLNKYHIITIGCAMNKADSERIEAFLEQNKYESTDDYNQADLIIMTTCGIRQSAEDRVYGLVHQMRKTNKEAKLVITGCLAKRKDVMRRLVGKVDLFMPINELPNIFNLLKVNQTEKVITLDDVRSISGEKYLSILPKHESEYTACVPIGNGCNNFCSYCVVPYARGREVYRSAQEIISEVQTLVNKGYKEILLIAQNVNSYQSEDYNFTKLLETLALIPGNFWLRFSSSHPKDVSDELIEVIASNQKICRHFHLALQSGNDDILMAMNRKYTADYYCNLVEKIRKSCPDISITTDVIVGFPGETEAQFNDTVKIFKKLKFEMAYISKYSPRPGTVSWKMTDNVSQEEKKDRDLILTKIFKEASLAANNRYLNKEVVVLVSGINKKGKYYGKSSNYKDVSFVLGNSGNDHEIVNNLVGNFVKVKINKVRNLALEGVFSSLLSL